MISGMLDRQAQMDVLDAVLAQAQRGDQSAALRQYGLLEQALAEELTRRGYTIHLMTDERVRDYGKSFPAVETHIVPSATLSLSKPWAVPGRALKRVGPSGRRSAPCSA